MVPHPRYAGFQAAVLRATVIAWSGDVYRFVRPRHAAALRLVDGLGAYKNGGRWNHIGVCPAVYCSLTPATAAREAESHCDREGIPYATTLPR
jgi:RES domain-containing protein